MQAKGASVIRYVITLNKSFLQKSKLAKTMKWQLAKHKLMTPSDSDNFQEVDNPILVPGVQFQAGGSSCQKSLSLNRARNLVYVHTHTHTIDQQEDLIPNLMFHRIIN